MSEQPWRQITITLKPGENGLEGVLSVAGIVYDVRAWRKAGEGMVRAEARLQTDPELDRWLEAP